MNTKFSLGILAAAAVLLAGCFVRSLHPLFTEQELVRYSDLVGTWSQDGRDDNSWTFVSTGRMYRLTHVDAKKRTATFLAGVGRIGTNIFLTAMAEDSAMEDRLNDLAAAHLVSAYSFFKIEKRGKNLDLVFLNPEWLDKQLKADPKLVAHVRRENEVILSAPTAELQKFVGRFASDTNAFKDALTLVPKP
jgi:hypothetical protein